MQPITIPHPSDVTTHPSPTAINTQAQKWASATLDRLIIAEEEKNASRLTRLTRRVLEAAFVPAYGREVQL